MLRNSDIIARGRAWLFRRSGLTLIEVVVIILAVLIIAALLVPVLRRGGQPRQRAPVEFSKTLETYGAEDSNYFLSSVGESGKPKEGRPVLVAETRNMLGTYLTLKVVAENEEKGRADIAAGFERIAELNRAMSGYQPDSELSRLNARAGREAVVVSDDLYRAIESGAAWNTRTGGAFDIACGPLVDLWRNCGKQNRLPTAEELERAKSLGGAARLLLDPKAHTVRFPVDGMRLDLGGHGKGFIADEVEKVLIKRGVRNALIAMSGDIRALGRTAEGKPWRVGVRDPRNPDSPDAAVTVLELSDRSVSTSGGYERFVVIQGKRYSHIVDPRTGRTAERVASDTIIGPDTTTTDVLDTGLNVLGVEDGLALVETLPGIEAMFITVDDRNELHITRSMGFAAFEAKQ